MRSKLQKMLKRKQHEEETKILYTVEPKYPVLPPTRIPAYPTRDPARRQKQLLKESTSAEVQYQIIETVFDGDFIISRRVVR